METIFKVGDKVYDFEFGWGVVADISRGGFYNTKVNFETKAKTIYFTRDGKYEHSDETPRLSFTEYDLTSGGFSQERPVDYSEYVGKWGKFWISGEKTVIIGKLNNYFPQANMSFEVKTKSKLVNCYDNFEPLTDEQLKVLALWL